ncbi:MAG: HEPN domain-containing protein [Chitinophagaceae bacterium]|nr:HEPN domain-containing protein [Chitinophagaceae bacterium]
MLQYQPTASLQELVTSLHQAVAIDKIFLLGVSAEGYPVNSIFRPTDHGNEPGAGYFLLLLTRPGEHRSDDVIQDMLEQRNRFRIPVHLMVYPVKMFYQWLQSGQFFALKVAEQAPILYNSGVTHLPEAGIAFRKVAYLKQQEQSMLGFSRSAAFLRGARYFISKKEYSLAAFLLHQAAEHACLSFILQYTGLRTGTHNIDKLLRYSMLIDDILMKVFPRRFEEEVELFRLLQKAYIHSRYKEDYNITEDEIFLLAGKVTKLCRLCNPDQEESISVVEEEAVPWTTLPGGRLKAGKAVRSSVPQENMGGEFLQYQDKYKNDHQYGTYG